METNLYKLKAKVWLYPGEAAWHMITIPKKEADEIKMEYIWPRRGFGAIPVLITIGKTTWKTSIFPQKEGSYILPLKKTVRSAEGVKEGDRIHFSLKVLN